jgi:hypothetical protein
MVVENKGCQEGLAHTPIILINFLNQPKTPAPIQLDPKKWYQIVTFFRKINEI